MIHLSVGRLEIDWGKNSGFTDHSALFQPTDLSRVPYYYVEEDSEPYTDELGECRYPVFTELKDGMSKALSEVIDRMNLLGHTISACKHEFLYLSQLNGFDADEFRFEHLADALAATDVAAISADYGDGDDFGKFFRRQIAPRLGLTFNQGEKSALQEVSEGMENLSAYAVLQLLAANPQASNLPVMWQFADVEDGGWASRVTFVRPLDRAHRFLVVTEGSSDASIIQHALKLLRPHIADFFEFVDMEEGYPFGGAGNLFRFLQGLVSIGIRNDVIAIFDNDVEGLSSYKRSSGLRIPDNMRILRLPDLPEFQRFPSEGPAGRHTADINGRAAAIECYLDTGSTGVVRWTSFDAKTGQYQGELQNKARYMKAFLEQRSPTADYDYDRIVSILTMIIDNCVQIRESAVIHSFDERSKALRQFELEEPP